MSQQVLLGLAHCRLLLPLGCRSFRLKAPGNRSHYDSLGVTPGATQSDIKTAYYKLSKLYHPDRNKGSQEAANHFKTINEAYEVIIVLGLY